MSDRTINESTYREVVEALTLALALSKYAAAPFFSKAQRQRDDDGAVTYVQPTTEEWWTGLRAQIEAAQPLLDAALATLQAVSPAQATARTPEALHAAIMNLQPFQEAGVSETYQRGYASGHWDARRAAAELVAASPSNGIAGDAAPQEQPHVSFVDGDSERAIEKWLSTIDPVAEADTEDQSHLAGGASQSVREQAVAYWECRSFDIEHGVWFPWGRVEGSARYPLEQRLADIRAKIAEGSRWELRALYASPLPAVQTVPDGYTLIGKDALQVLFNALERDAKAGRAVRGEMVAAARQSVELGQQRLDLAALHQAHQKGGA